MLVTPNDVCNRRLAFGLALAFLFPRLVEGAPVGRSFAKTGVQAMYVGDDLIHGPTTAAAAVRPTAATSPQPREEAAAPANAARKSGTYISFPDADIITTPSQFSGSNRRRLEEEHLETDERVQENADMLQHDGVMSTMVRRGRRLLGFHQDPSPDGAASGAARAVLGKRNRGDRRAEMFARLASGVRRGLGFVEETASGAVADQEGDKVEYIASLVAGGRRLDEQQQRYEQQQRSGQGASRMMDYLANAMAGIRRLSEFEAGSDESPVPASRTHNHHRRPSGHWGAHLNDEQVHLVASMIAGGGRRSLGQTDEMHESGESGAMAQSGEARKHNHSRRPMTSERARRDHADLISTALSGGRRLGDSGEGTRTTVRTPGPEETADALASFSFSRRLQDDRQDSRGHTAGAPENDEPHGALLGRRLTPLRAPAASPQAVGMAPWEIAFGAASVGAFVVISALIGTARFVRPGARRRSASHVVAPHVDEEAGVVAPPRHRGGDERKDLQDCPINEFHHPGTVFLDV